MNINGKVLHSLKAFLRPANRSYRYGDGLFETIRVNGEHICLSALHFERLLSGLSVLKFQVPKSFTPVKLENEILELCKKNKCGKLARVRLSVSRGNGGLYDGDESFQYVIECWPLQATAAQLNTNGLIIDCFVDGNKSCDAFSNLKSANHLIYVMAAQYAKENKLNDSVVLNAYNRICDSTVANVFWVKDQNIFTPPLSEGCIAGVMRKYLIGKLQATSHKLHEKPCEINDLENADEVFVTNAIQGIRWVKQFRNKKYANDLTAKIYQLSQSGQQ